MSRKLSIRLLTQLRIGLFRVQLRYNLTALNGPFFLYYRNKKSHLYDFLLRFVKWVLRAYEYWQLRP